MTPRSDDISLFGCGDIAKNPEVHVCIVKNGILCDDNHIGVIYVQSPSVAVGYFPANRTVFTVGTWFDFDP